MYGLIACPGCDILRIIDMDTLTSECPYCGKNCEHRYLKTLYENRDQSVVRDALTHMYGFSPEKKDMKKIETADPHSTLVYKYEHCSSMLEKMEILSKGLTEIYGTFTLENVEEIDSKNAKKLLASMCEACLVAEIRPGRFKT